MPHRRKGDHRPRHTTHAVKPANRVNSLPWEKGQPAAVAAPAENAAVKTETPASPTPAPVPVE